MLNNVADTKPTTTKVLNNRTITNSPTVQITTIRLNGDNFLRWAQSVRMFIRGQGKIDYITGEKTTPNPADPSFARWNVENSKIMTWLITSMGVDISCNFMCYSTAKELCDSHSDVFWFGQPITNILFES